MIKLTEFLSPDQIQYGVIASSKKRALELVGKAVAETLNQQHTDESPKVCPIECFAQLFKREKLGSTALNHGIAFPHAKLPDSDQLPLTQPIAVFFKLDNPIDFDASDHKDVDLIYAMLFPEQHCAHYKNHLPELAQRLTDKNLLKQLRSAASRDDIWQILHLADQHAEEQVQSTLATAEE